MAGLAAARMSGASGLACEKERSLNLVRSRGVTYLLLEADRRPVRVAVLLDVRTMSLRYAGHLPVCIPYMIVHSLKSIWQQIGSQCSTIRSHWSGAIDDTTDEWQQQWWHDPAWPTPFLVAASVCSDQWRVLCTPSLSIVLTIIAEQQLVSRKPGGICSCWKSTPDYCFYEFVYSPQRQNTSIKYKKADTKIHNMQINKKR